MASKNLPLNYTIINGNPSNPVPGSALGINPIGVEIYCKGCDILAASRNVTITGFPASVASGSPVSGTASIPYVVLPNPYIRISGTATIDEYGIYGDFSINDSFFASTPVTNAVTNLWLNSGMHRNCVYAQITYSSSMDSSAKTLKMSINIITSIGPNCDQSQAWTSAANPNAALAAYRSFYTSPFRAPAPAAAYASLASVSGAVANQCTVVETDSHTITICKKA
jgi:hypothetical protein